MKIIVWDIETAPISTFSWDLYPGQISHNNLITDWYILCACWKELGKSKVHSVSCFDEGKRNDDYNVVKKMREVLEDADLVIHHYGDKFDLPKLNARLVYHRLKPLPKLLTIDTKIESSRVAKFTSNRLDYLSKHFGFEGKIKTDFNLWLDIVVGKKEKADVAMNKMVRYCKEDVRQLEKAYLTLRPYMLSHPNIADPGTHNCPKCNSTNVNRHKVRMSRQGIYRQQYQCGNCGSYFTERTSLKNKALSKV